jgi:hypothetical protein
MYYIDIGYFGKTASSYIIKQLYHDRLLLDHFLRSICNAKLVSSCLHVRAEKISTLNSLFSPFPSNAAIIKRWAIP